MGQGYYRAIKTRRLIALLVRQGFVSSGGSKHGKYVRDGKEEAVIIPRHRTISPGTSRQICEVLEKDYKISKKELEKLF